MGAPKKAPAKAPVAKATPATKSMDHNEHIDALIQYATDIEPGSGALPSITSHLEHVRHQISTLLAGK